METIFQFFQQDATLFQMLTWGGTIILLLFALPFFIKEIIKDRDDMKKLLRDIKRVVWNRGIKLQWYRLWIRKNEFHHSLNTDIEAIIGMNDEQYKVYEKDLIKRRQIAHQKNMARCPW